jgi:hypothetical protein
MKTYERQQIALLPECLIARVRRARESNRLIQFNKETNVLLNKSRQGCIFERSKRGGIAGNSSDLDRTFNEKLDNDLFFWIPMKKRMPRRDDQQHLWLS